MSDFITAVFVIIRFWESPDPIATLLSLNPLEQGGLAALAGVAITLCLKAVKVLKSKLRQ